MHARTILDRCLGPLLSAYTLGGWRHCWRRWRRRGWPGADADRYRPALRRRGEAAQQDQALRPVARQPPPAAGRRAQSMRRWPARCSPGCRAADRDRLVGPEGGSVVASAARLAAGGRSQSDPVRGGAPAERSWATARCSTASCSVWRAAAGRGGADHRRRFRLQGAVLPRGRAPGLALGRTGARARLRDASSTRWVSCQSIFRARNDDHRSGLGEGDWVRSNPLRAIFVLVRRRQGTPRQDRRTANGRAPRRARRPRAAPASHGCWWPRLRFAEWPAKRLVRSVASACKSSTASGT